MQKTSLLFVVALLIAAIPMGTVAAEDYSVWQYHKILTVSGNTTSIPVGYQINFTLYKGAGTDAANIFYLNNHAENDLSDLRFVDGEGTLLDMWNETTIAANHVHVWIELAGSLTIIMYYGNEYANSEWDASTTIFERVITSGIILALPMNEGSGTTIYDYSGNENDGAITGCTWVDTGRFGTALNFADNQYVTLASDSLNFTSGTFAWQFYLDNADVTTQQYIMDKLVWTTSGYMLIITGGNFKIYFATAAHEVQTSAITTGEHSFAFTRGAVTNALWTDGVSSGALGGTSDAVVNTIAPVLGGTQGTPTVNSFVNTTFSGLYIFNPTLTDAEIADFNTDYPQCSESNLGQIFLREWIDVVPSLSAGTEVNEEESTDYTAIYTFGLFAVLAIVLLLFKFGFPLLNLVFGIVTLALVALTIGSEYVIFAPYLQLGIALTAIILMLTSAEKGIKT